MDLPSWKLTNQKSRERGSILIPLYHFHSLTKTSRHLFAATYLRFLPRTFNRSALSLNKIYPPLGISSVLKLIYILLVDFVKDVINFSVTHWVKSFHIRSFSGPYFPTSGLNIERYSVSIRIQSEYGKYGPEKFRMRTLFMQWQTVEFNSHG